MPSSAAFALTAGSLLLGGVAVQFTPPVPATVHAGAKVRTDGLDRMPVLVPDVGRYPMPVIRPDVSDLPMPVVDGASPFPR